MVNPGEICELRMEIIISNLELDVADCQIDLNNKLHPMVLIMKANYYRRLVTLIIFLYVKRLF